MAAECNEPRLGYILYNYDAYDVRARNILIPVLGMGYNNYTTFNYTTEKTPLLKEKVEICAAYNFNHGFLKVCNFKAHF